MAPEVAAVHPGGNLHDRHMGARSQDHGERQLSSLHFVLSKDHKVSDRFLKISECFGYQCFGLRPKQQKSRSRFPMEVLV